MKKVKSLQRLIYTGTNLKANSFRKVNNPSQQAKSGIVMVSCWRRSGMIRIILNRHRFSCANDRRHMTEARLLRVSILATYWSVTEREEEERAQSNAFYRSVRKASPWAEKAIMTGGSALQSRPRWNDWEEDGKRMIEIKATMRSYVPVSSVVVSTEGFLNGCLSKQVENVTRHFLL